MSASSSSLHPSTASSSSSNNNQADDLIQGRRRRSSSVKQIASYIAHPPADHHLQHLDNPPPPLHDRPTPLPTPEETAQRLAKAKSRHSSDSSEAYGPKALQWVQRPGDSFIVIGIVVALYCAWEILLVKPALSSSTTTDLTRLSNPFAPFLFISYPLPHNPSDPPDVTRYRKGWLDIAFLAFWVVGFSFLRQAITIWLVKPLGLRWGIKKGRKLERFQEQGYAVVYFGTSSIAGLYVMSHQDTWFFQTKAFWEKYPHWDMPRAVKVYYLTQFAYWLQQALVMLARLEKPRDDYVELVLHHIITLWLVGASYFVNLTQIGICVFVSMDIPDFLLAVSKCINYLGLEQTGNVSFIIFMFAWGYLRHYQNIRILNSVWTEFKLVPKDARAWDPKSGSYMPNWMRYQIYLPIAALQLVIAFWSFLILRIVYRMLLGRAASDVREENESGLDTDTGGGSSSGVAKKRSRTDLSDQGKKNGGAGSRRRDSTTVRKRK